MVYIALGFRGYFVENYKNIYLNLQFFLQIKILEKTIFWTMKCKKFVKLKNGHLPLYEVTWK